MIAADLVVSCSHFGVTAAYSFPWLFDGLGWTLFNNLARLMTRVVAATSWVCWSVMRLSNLVARHLLGGGATWEGGNS